MTTDERKLSPPLSVREIVLEQVRYIYAGAEKPGVDDVSLRITTGELVAIVGPNGCGKSTLLKLLIGSLPARGAGRGGRILVDGRTPAQIGRIGMARRVAMVPQMAGMGSAGADGGLASGGFSVREVVLMSRYAAHVEQAGSGAWRALGQIAALGFETTEDLRFADLAMWASDVHHLAHRPIETLSGGERQRVTIARAMAQQTPVLLLDEPTSALDLHHQLELIAQLEELTRAGRIILIVTHDLNLAARFATRVVVMDQGRIVADGAPAKVLTATVLEPVYRVKVQEQADGTLRFERKTT